jgi:hypothetical protein
VNLNSVIDLVMTPHRFGDRTLGGSCKKVDGRSWDAVQVGSGTA